MINNEVETTNIKNRRLKHQRGERLRETLIILEKARQGEGRSEDRERKNHAH